jgi:hypothetical protein
VGGHHLPRAAERRIEIVNPAAIADRSAPIDDDRFGRDRGADPRGEHPVAIDRRGDALIAILVEVLPHRVRRDVRVLVDQRAANPAGRIRRADALNLGRVTVRDGAVRRHEQEHLRDAGRFERTQDRSVNRRDLQRSGRDGRQPEPRCQEEGRHLRV